MCLMITAFAAVVATILWYFKPELKKEAKLGMLALMYWGAALMWTVDGFFCVAAGEGFLELSLNDALLGAVIVLCGLIAWVVSLLLSNPQRLLAAIKGDGKA
ncbi:MAG: hypothetical protein RR295_08300 [Oscillospiraceae bacterium]